MKINFVTIADPTIASYRYHNAIPARELELMGHEVKVTQFPRMDADRYIFSKHFNPSEYWTMKGMVSEGKETVFHCCDNHFANDHAEHYRRMITTADRVICTTPEMAEVIWTETERRATVIPDTYEMAQIEPSYNFDGKMKVLWFGHPVNLKGLAKVLPLPEWCELRLVTNLAGPDGKQIKLGEVFDGIACARWSIDNLIHALKWCDCVILPVEDTPSNRTRSHNRLLESVRRGKFVIASPIPAYMEYTDDMYIGDVQTGLIWLKGQEKELIEARIARCQKYIEENYNPKKVGEMWQTALK